MHRFVSLNGENQYFTPFVKIFVCVQCTIGANIQDVCVCLWTEINLSSCYQLLCKNHHKNLHWNASKYLLYSQEYSTVEFQPIFFTYFFFNKTEFCWPLGNLSMSQTSSNTSLQTLKYALVPDFGSFSQVSFIFPHKMHK